MDLYTALCAMSCPTHMYEYTYDNNSYFNPLNAMAHIIASFYTFSLQVITKQSRIMYTFSIENQTK